MGQAKVRQSNIELLRIVAMFLVLVVHADFFSLGEPTLTDLNNNPLNYFTRVFFESISILCVNVFIMISGWFGIRANVKSFCNFVFQCLFFLIGIYVSMLIGGKAEFTIKGIAGCFALTHWNWFIKAYIGLYILAPVLNAFIENVSKRQLGITLLSFYIFQTIYGMTGAAVFIEAGYSTFSFIGLYMLSRYLRLYGESIYRYGFRLFALSVLCLLGGYLVLTLLNVGVYWFSYINPFVITGATGMLMWFNSMNINASIGGGINFIAKSSFAVFLLHTNPNIIVDVFKPTIQNIYNIYNGVECLGMIFIFLLLVFVIAVILDQPRKLLWNVIYKRFSH